MRLRLTIAVAALAVCGAAGAAAARWDSGRDDGGAATRRETPAATTTVRRMTLTNSVVVQGELGFGEAEPVSAVATGTVTWLPAVGSTVQRGGPLLRADEKPVLLFYGSLPMYRALEDGAKGADVEQFERNLAALGYRGFTVDQVYSPSTVAAVKRWQHDLGLDETGTVERHQVVYAPSALRVAGHTVRPGAPATGDILTATGRDKVVTVQVDLGGAPWAIKGTRVIVILPGGTTVAGTVAAIGTQPTAAGVEGNSTQTVLVRVELANQKATAKFDQMPVEVRYVAQERKNVLTVPVGALLALAEGGYGLELADGRLVPVRTGLVAGGQVEVSGPGIEAGTTVGVAQ